MKRLFTLTLALLMALTLFGTGARRYAYAEEENPYVGLWQITGQQEGETYTSYEEQGVEAYLEFLPNGAIYGVMGSEEEFIEDYMAYQVTGENTLDIYEGEDALPSVYDPSTGVITVTDPDSGLASFVERVTADPLPDIRSLVDNSDRELTYYGYRMTNNGQTVDMLEYVPLMGMDPEDFYLTLEPDGTGYLQFGAEESGGEITWTETEIIPVENPDQPVTYTRQDDHISFMVEGVYVEFAPEGEVEALMAMKGIEVAGSAEAVDIDVEEMVGEWKLAKASAMGQELTIEQIQAQGLDLAFRFNGDGSAVMINKGEETDGLSWTAEGGELTLSVGTYELFTFTYDGEYLILSVGARMYFEKVG